jgi:hypothetical protein
MIELERAFAVIGCLPCASVPFETSPLLFAPASVSNPFPPIMLNSDSSCDVKVIAEDGGLERVVSRSVTG